MDCITQRYRLEDLVILVLLCVLQQHHADIQGYRRFIQAGIVLLLAPLRQGLIQLCLAVADDYSVFRIIFLGIGSHFNIIKSQCCGLDCGIAVDQRTIHMPMIGHSVSVVRFGVDPGNNCGGIHLLRYTILRDIFAVSYLHTVVSAYSLIDDDGKIVIQDFSAPAL